MFSAVQDLEVDLGLAPGFYRHLLDEDDWSFVIKLCALFEAACTRVLAVRLRYPDLETPLARIPFADIRAGKLALIAGIGALSPQQLSSLRGLAELRNRLAHRITEVSFTFENHVGTMDSNQFARFLEQFGSVFSDPVVFDDHSVPRSIFTRENPKLAVWLRSAEILGSLNLELYRHALEEESAELTKLAAKSYLDFGKWLSVKPLAER